jgi:hypothetical protein
MGTRMMESIQTGAVPWIAHGNRQRNESRAIRRQRLFDSERSGFQDCRMIAAENIFEISRPHRDARKNS